ncbi:MAG: hypothetical protein ACLQGP_11745 [Isosphaeraceae bacterium]
MSSKFVLLACLASTLYMTGVIVLVQVVHYPLFERVEAMAFRRYHAEHVRLMTLLVLGPMVVELLSSAWLVFRRPEGPAAWLAWAGLAAAVVTWAATARLSVPLHDRLARGFDPEAHHALVRTNFVRTIAWFVHASTVLVITAGAMH